MNLFVIGCNHRTAPVALRERVAFGPDRLERALDEIVARFDCEVAIVSTCNRVELYLGRDEDNPNGFDLAQVSTFLAEFHQIELQQLRGSLYSHFQADAVLHLFRVVASLDSLIVGEGQIAGQIKRAYELAHDRRTVGPLLHALFQHAHKVAKRVRTETSIAQGHVSVSSVAVDYVRQVFERFTDKTMLVIGAGKMGELTLRHLRHLDPQRILVANRSPEKAQAVAATCGGTSVPWEQLDEALGKADIVLSTTGAAEPIISLERYQKIRARRAGRPVVILDIAVPRDFDPRIHDGDATCLFNIDDLQRIRERTLQDRLRHVPAVQTILEEERGRFLREWTRRRNGPTIARLTQDLEAKRQAIVQQLLSRLNGKLTSADRAYIEGAFRLLQNQFLHGPISALTDESPESESHTLRDALRKLFRLHD